MIGSHRVCFPQTGDRPYTESREAATKASNGCVTSASMFSYTELFLSPCPLGFTAAFLASAFSDGTLTVLVRFKADPILAVVDGFGAEVESSEEEAGFAHKANDSATCFLGNKPGGPPTGPTVAAGRNPPLSRADSFPTTTGASAAPFEPE